MRLERGASEWKHMTIDPAATARLRAGVTELASEQETAMPCAPLRASASIASACFWASSSVGVCQSMVMSALYFSPNSFAASFAPAYAAWKTALDCDLA